ncbi:Na+/H+ antiporter subunit G [Roseovarius sp. S4756]|uniref:Na+/H+ antiporter subunit G n=1 Tax=Roseovarius maritimus TaxID=3342637 RepID=UPI00372A711A
MTWDIVATYAVAACLIVGAAFSLIGSIGLLKFNDAMTRLHAPTKVGTVGIGALLLAAMIHSYLIGEGVLHEILIMAFLFVTAPISANFMAKVNLHRRECDTPPAPHTDETWSTLNVPEADRELAEQAED